VSLWLQHLGSVLGGSANSSQQASPDTAAFDPYTAIGALLMLCGTTGGGQFCGARCVGLLSWGNSVDGRHEQTVSGEMGARVSKTRANGGRGGCESGATG